MKKDLIASSKKKREIELNASLGVILANKIKRIIRLSIKKD